MTPGSSIGPATRRQHYRDFLDSPQGQRAQAEVDQLGRLAEAEAAREPRPADAVPAREGVPTRVDDAAPVRIDESTPPRVDRQAPAHAEEIGPPAAEAPRAAQMPPSDASVPRSEARLIPETPAPRAEQPAGDPATQALRDSLPKALTDRVDVRVNPDLDGNTVRVIPDPHGGPRRGVRVEAGPDATPTDVLLHAHTVQSMQRYGGISAGCDSSRTGSI